MEFKTQKKNNKTKIDNKTIGENENLITKIEPLEYLVKKIKTQSKKNIEIIYLSPQGKKINQNDIKKINFRKEIIIINGKNKGLDERILKNIITKELSIGDYIINNGDLAATIFINAIIRLNENFLNLKNKKDSFKENKLFDYPNYTKPEKFKNLTIPRILKSGNRKKIKKWQKIFAKKKTWLYRPDLIKNI